MYYFLTYLTVENIKGIFIYTDKNKFMKMKKILEDNPDVINEQITIAQHHKLDYIFLETGDLNLTMSIYY